MFCFKSNNFNKYQYFTKIKDVLLGKEIEMKIKTYLYRLGLVFYSKKVCLRQN
jgi:hypothetical protein